MQRLGYTINAVHLLYLHPPMQPKRLFWWPHAEHVLAAAADHKQLRPAW